MSTSSTVDGQCCARDVGRVTLDAILYSLGQVITAGHSEVPIFTADEVNVIGTNVRVGQIHTVVEK